jgi:hypothetical protein
MLTIMFTFTRCACSCSITRFGFAVTRVDVFVIIETCYVWLLCDPSDHYNHSTCVRLRCNSICRDFVEHHMPCSRKKSQGSSALN